MPMLISYAYRDDFLRYIVQLGHREALMLLPKKKAVHPSPFQYCKIQF